MGLHPYAMVEEGTDDFRTLLAIGWTVRDGSSHDGWATLDPPVYTTGVDVMRIDSGPTHVVLPRATYELVGSVYRAARAADPVPVTLSDPNRFDAALLVFKEALADYRGHYGRDALRSWPQGLLLDALDSGANSTAHDGAANAQSSPDPDPVQVFASAKTAIVEMQEAFHAGRLLCSTINDYRIAVSRRIGALLSGPDRPDFRQAQEDAFQVMKKAIEAFDAVDNTEANARAASVVSHLQDLATAHVAAGKSVDEAVGLAIDEALVPPQVSGRRTFPEMPVRDLVVGDRLRELIHGPPERAATGRASIGMDEYGALLVLRDTVGVMLDEVPAWVDAVVREAPGLMALGVRITSVAVAVIDARDRALAAQRAREADADLPPHMDDLPGPVQPALMTGTHSAVDRELLDVYRRIVHAPGGDLTALYDEAGRLEQDGERRQVRPRAWREFQRAGMLWWVNRQLHLFGWALTLVVSGPSEDEAVVDAYPARTRFRGFDGDAEDRGFARLSAYLRDNATDLADEAPLRPVDREPQD